MGNAKRAVDAATVLNGTAHVHIVMILAEVGRSEAEVEGLSAASVTLPGDVFVAVLGAVVLTSTNHFDLARFADEVLLLGGLSGLQVALAVDLATVVRLLAVMALVESTLLHDKLCRRLSVPFAAGVSDGGHIDQVFLGGNFDRELLNLSLEVVDLFDFGLEGWAVV